jgi:hypothetical protein
MTASNIACQTSPSFSEARELSLEELQSVSAGIAPIVAVAARYAIRAAVVVVVASLGGSTKKE